MRRVVLALLLALLTFDVSGLAAMCGDACDDCPTDVSGGDCAPNCHACNCSLPKVAGTAEPALVAPASQGVSWIAASEDIPSPEPADILHVPKSLLA